MYADPVNKLHEPTTTITDLIIFGLGLYFACGVYEHYSIYGTAVHFHFAGTFLFMGLAGLFGALTHGFGPDISQRNHQFLWRITLVCIGLTTVFMLLGGLTHILPDPSWIHWLPVIGLIIFIAAIFKNDKFKTVVLFYVPGMILVLVMMVVSYFTTHNDGALWIIASIVIGFVGAGIQQSGFSLHTHFNHNDIYHVIQMGGMILLYKGTIVLNSFS